MPSNNTWEVGTSDFSSSELRLHSYPSFYFGMIINGVSAMHEYEVTPECHQAVLNEIAARPSNLGYGLGMAMRKMLDFTSSILKGKKATESKLLVAQEQSAVGLQDSPEKCTSESLGAESTQRLLDCVSTTEELRDALFALEEAEKAQYDCLLEQKLTEKSVRHIQWGQQAVGYRTHPQQWKEVGSHYRNRRGYESQKKACQDKTDHLHEAAVQAESLETKQHRKCSVKY